MYENIKLGLSMGLLGALLLYIGTLVFMPDMTIKIFRFQPFVTLTESMDPVINVNDVVFATPFKETDAKKGDIITFKADIDYNGTSEYVTHYIYSIDNSGSETIIRTHRHFEDAKEVTPDTWLIPSSDVIGSYQFHIPYLGMLIGFVKSMYGIVIISINIIIFSAIKFISNKNNKETEEMESSNLVNNPKQDTVLTNN